jgi:hypothetical protein
MEHPENAETTAESHAPTAPAPSLERIVAATEKYAREEPGRAVSAAFGTGLILTLLPVGAIVSGVLRLALALVRPFLIILGVVKLYERLGDSSAEPSPSPDSRPSDNAAAPSDPTRG